MEPQAMHAVLNIMACVLQARNGQKHTAEYQADKPLCGTWAEIDGKSPASYTLAMLLLLAVLVYWPIVWLVNGFTGGMLLADEGIAPMDDFLKAKLPANLTPSLLRHLPELDVSQPDKVLGHHCSASLMLVLEVQTSVCAVCKALLLVLNTP